MAHPVYDNNAWNCQTNFEYFPDMTVSVNQTDNILSVCLLSTISDISEIK